MRMKWLGWGLLAFLSTALISMPSQALETVPTTPPKTSGPFLITGYSFTGSSLRYVQIYNASNSLASLDGWTVMSFTKSAPVSTVQHVVMSGQLEPGKHVVASIPGLIDRPSFIFGPGTSAATPDLGTVMLVAPPLAGFNDETVTVPAVTASTIKEPEGAFTNYYVKRDLSSTTGNYVSGSSFALPPFTIKNDQLYEAPQPPALQIIEVYADALDCSPFDTSPLCNDYVKLYNPSANDIDLSRYRIRTGDYGQSPSSSNTKVLNEVLPAGGHVVAPMTLSSSGSWIWIEDVYGMSRYQMSAVEYPSNAGHVNEAWAYDSVADSWRWTNIPIPTSAPSMFPVPAAVNGCDGLRITEIAANVASEKQFVELYNPNDTELDVTGCVIMTNRSSAGHVVHNTKLEAYARMTVYIGDTDLTLTKTTSGTVYLLSSDLTTEVDQVAYSDLKETTSWAEIDGVWLQTYAVTPGAANLAQAFPACDDGYVRNLDTGNCNKITAQDGTIADCGPGKYRSPDTNRCRSLEALATALTPCDIGQYRNPETNRCRSLLSTTSSLTPCAAGQVRNPDTNRCRAATSDEGLKPCDENQERNPDTNRCRNKAGAVNADFAVETIAQSGEATLGWWAFGGVGTLAAGYAGWEWRREVTGWIRRKLPFGIGRP